MPNFHLNHKDAEQILDIVYQIKNLNLKIHDNLILLEELSCWIVVH